MATKKKQIAKDEDYLSIAAATRFQRSMIACLSFAAVLAKTPYPCYFIVFTALIGSIISPRFEILRVFYLHVVRKLLGRDIFTFQRIYSGAFLLEDDAERFIFAVIAIFNITGIALYFAGYPWWIAPVAIVAAGTTLSATIGVCLMAIMYVTFKEKRGA